MKRKQFLITTSAAALGAAGGYGFGSSSGSSSTQAFPNHQSEHRSSGNLLTSVDLQSSGQGKRLKEFREIYRRDLFDRFIPNLVNYVVDPEYGGFMCDMDIRSGERQSTNKRAWYEGRGIWLFSYLYNHLEADPRYLEIARQSKDFILQHRPSHKEFWPSRYSREGAPLSGEEGDIFGNLYIAEGLAEYALASGEEEYLQLAREITLESLARYDDPGYRYPAAGAGDIEGPRVLNHWMVFLFLSSRLLEQGPSPEIQSLADRCIEAVLEHHLHPRYNLLSVVLNHDLSRPGDERSQAAGTGLAIQTLWMMMYEAVRRQDEQLLDRASELFDRHVAAARDPVYGGYFNTLSSVEKHDWALGKSLGLHDEIMIGLMLQMEHGTSSGAYRRFEGTHSYIQDHFIRSEHLFQISGGDRTLEEYNTTRVEHYHHPRHLMLNLTALERIISVS